MYSFRVLRLFQYLHKLEKYPSDPYHIRAVPRARQITWGTAEWLCKQDFMAFFLQIGAVQYGGEMLEHFEPESRLKAQGRANFGAASQDPSHVR